MKTALEEVQARGGAGYTRDWPVERYMRDAKLLDIDAGTNEIRRMLIGRELIAHERPRARQQAIAEERELSRQCCAQFWRSGTAR